MRLGRITAIAQLTVREAVRSRLLLSLGTFLVAGLIGLPLLIAGDNTLAGQIQIILNYTLTYATAILTATTLWTSCGGVSTEIQDRRLYLVLTKPLHRYELWVGKWLGIAGLNAALLILTGFIIGAMTWHAIRNSTDDPVTKRAVCEQFLMARETLLPVTPDWSRLIETNTWRLMQSGQAPRGMTANMIRTKLLEELNNQRFTIPPGKEIRFAYEIAARETGDHDLILNYKLESTRPERAPVAARWLIGYDPAQVFQVNVTNYPGVPCTLPISSHVVNRPGTLAITYQRLDSGSQATLMMAMNNPGPELRVASGSFSMNLARGLLVILCKLAFLAALGLVAGCLLSTPVAVFTAFFIMILLASAGYVESVATSGVFYVPHEGPELVQTGLDRLILHLFKAFSVMTRPLIQLDPVPLLTDGRIVGWDLVLRAMAWLAGLYTAITALIGIMLFNRRELG
ncbi:MAG: hypothetical protein WCO42_07710 [bacterium]